MSILCPHRQGALGTGVSCRHPEPSVLILAGSLHTYSHWFTGLLCHQQPWPAASPGGKAILGSEELSLAPGPAHWLTCLGRGEPAPVPVGAGLGDQTGPAEGLRGPGAGRRVVGTTCWWRPGQAHPQTSSQWASCPEVFVPGDAARRCPASRSRPEFSLSLRGCGEGMSPIRAAVQAELWQLSQTRAEVSSGGWGSCGRSVALRLDSKPGSASPRELRAGLGLWQALASSSRCPSPVCSSVPRIWQSAQCRAWPGPGAGTGS